MTTTTRRALTITGLMLAGFFFIAGDMHRTILAEVWPYLVAFWDYQAK